MNLPGFAFNLKQTKQSFSLAAGPVFCFDIPVQSSSGSTHCDFGNTAKCMDAKNTDSKLEELIIRALYENTGHEAILVPQRFNPPIMLSNIFRLGCQLKRKGFTTAPDRRMGGWHMRLLAPGIDYCQAGQVSY